MSSQPIKHAPPVTPPPTGPRESRALYRLDAVLSFLAASVCVGLLAYKIWLVSLQNVNWDEFYFLSHVYSLARGELSLLMQGAYTHLFSWLRLVPGNEVQQIVVARYVMTAALALTSVLVWRLARTWLSGSAAMIPSLVYLSAMPILFHGNSFRYDSMLAPLVVAALVLLLAPPHNRKNDIAAGVVLGAAFALTMKVVLFAPMLLLVVLFREQAHPGTDAGTLQGRLVPLLHLALAAGTTAAVLLGLHWLTVVAPANDSATVSAVGAARTTLLDTPWFPRSDVLKMYSRWQPLPWVLMLLGALLAVLRRRYSLAALFLALLPITFYRNAFPYFYVVMLAPASLLAGYAVQEITKLVRAYSTTATTALVVVTVWLGLFYQGLAYTARFNVDDQSFQRWIVGAVHEIFPESVNYIDRCAMISSFRKVNFFMSTWGMQMYRDSGKPVMASILKRDKPAFLIENAGPLITARPNPYGLLEPDRELLRQYYPRYWGPVRVAGGTVIVQPGGASEIGVPFAAAYRLESPVPVRLNGVPHRPGDTIDVADSVTVTMDANDDAGPARVTLFLAQARPRPGKPPPRQQMFAPL